MIKRSIIKSIFDRESHITIVRRKKMKRKKFYQNVTFESKEAKKYLYEPIFHFAKKQKLNQFENITNYVGHATVPQYYRTGKMLFEVEYPITISGTSISKIQIKDAKGEIFYIALKPPSQIIFYEVKNDMVECYIANHEPKNETKRFTEKKVYYQVKEMEEK